MFQARFDFIKSPENLIGSNKIQSSYQPWHCSSGNILRYWILNLTVRLTV